MQMSQGIVNMMKAVVRRFNFAVPVTRNNVRFKIPLIQQMGTQNLRKGELWMTELLSKLLPDLQDEIFIDIGANLGQTLLKVKSIDAQTDYYGFEPNPACCYYLEELIKINHFNKVTVFPVAISERTSIVSLYIHEGKDTAGSSASLLKDFKNANISFQKMVPVFNLADLRNEYFQSKIVGILKVDVEGAELETLTGAKKAIETDRPVIICELLPPINDLTRSETLQKKRQLQQMLEGLRYYMFKIIKGKTDHIAGITALSDLALETTKSKGWDYLFIPDTKLSYIRSKFNLLGN